MPCQSSVAFQSSALISGFAPSTLGSLGGYRREMTLATTGFLGAWLEWSQPAIGAHSSEETWHSFNLVVTQETCTNSNPNHKVSAVVSWRKRNGCREMELDF